MERIVIEIVGDTTKLQSTIDQLQKLGQVDNQNAKTFQSNNKKTNQAINQTTKDVGYLNNQIENLGNTIAGAFAVGALVQFGKQAVQTSAQIESVGKSLEFITGSAKSAQTTMEYLRSLSEKLGLDFVSTAKAFKQFAGAATQSGSTLGQTKTIFEQVSKAVTTMGLSAEDAEGVFLALSQIMSKGTVQAEELRGQIGERIPGAFGIAAKAIGVTEQQLNKMLEQGQVISKDFLPKFAAQLEKDLGGGAENAANSTQAALNRLSNAWNEFLTFTGQKLSPAIKELTKIFQGLTYAMRGEAGEREAASRQQGVEYAKEIVSELDKLNDLNAKSDAALEKRNFYYKRLFQTQQEINSLLAEREAIITKGGAQKNARLESINLEIEALAGNKYMYEEIITALKDYDKELSKDTQAAEENNKKKEKQLSVYEQLVKAASDLEAAMRNTLALNGIVSPKAIAQLDDLKMKIQTIEISMKNLNDPLLKSAGGKPLGVTSDLPNELPTGDFGESAQKAEYDALLGLHEDFLSELGSQDQMYTEAYLNELEKRKAAQQENQQLLINGTFQLLEMSANAFYDAVRQSDQAATDFQLANLKELYDSKSITEKEYEEKRKRILNEDAQRQHEMAIYQAATQAALGILYAMQGDPYTLAARVAVAAAIGLAQTAIVAAQPVPQFAEGTDRVRGGVKGKDSVHALLMPDEAVIKTSENMKYPGLAKAWNEGKLEDYVMSNFMLPMINPKNYELEQQKSFAENVANSIVLNQDFGTLESKLKKIEQAEREGAAFIAKEVSRAINNNQRSGY